MAGGPASARQGGNGRSTRAAFQARQFGGEGGAVLAKVFSKASRCIRIQYATSYAPPGKPPAAFSPGSEVGHPLLTLYPLAAYILRTSRENESSDTRALASLPVCMALPNVIDPYITNDVARILLDRSGVAPRASSF